MTYGRIDAATRVQLQQTQLVLAEGEQSRRPVRELPGGINGRLAVHAFTQRSSGLHVPEAVLKPIAQGGGHEVFAYEVAKAMGVEHLLAVTGRRANGDAAILFRPGATLESQGLRSSEALERELARGYAATRGLSPQAAAKQARIDRQLMQAFHIVIGNRDAHGRNALLDAREGLALLDNGKLASFKKQYVQYNSDFSRGPDVQVLQAGWDGRRGRDLVELRFDQEVRDVLARTDRFAIERAFGQLERDLPRSGPIGDNGVRPDRTWLPRIFGALDDIVDSGTLRYVASHAL